MTLADYIFYFFILTAAVSATGVLLIKNVFKGALLLLVCLLSVAAIYIFLFAEFVAISQLLIYAGGVMVVIIFGIMLTSTFSGKPLAVENGNVFGGIFIALLLFLLLANFISAEILTSPSENAFVKSDIEAIGINLITSYALPFEVAGALLLVALIGAAVISSPAKPKNT